MSAQTYLAVSAKVLDNVILTQGGINSRDKDFLIDRARLGTSRLNPASKENVHRIFQHLLDGLILREGDETVSSGNVGDGIKLEINRFDDSIFTKIVGKIG